MSLEGKTTSLTPKIFHESRVCFQLLLQSCPIRLTDSVKLIACLNFVSFKNFVSNKVPEHIFFQIPPITPSQVSAFIQKLDPGKATGLDGVGPRVLKMACNVISPSIAALINKSLTSSHFPNQLKLAK